MLTALSKFFNQRQLALGNGLFRSESVHLEFGTPTAAGALVYEFTRPFSTRIDYFPDQHNFRVSCSCRKINTENKYCSHLWALILEADAQGRALATLSDDLAGISKLSWKDRLNQMPVPVPSPTTVTAPQDIILYTLADIDDEDNSVTIQTQRLTPNKTLTPVHVTRAFIKTITNPHDRQLLSILHGSLSTQNDPLPLHAYYQTYADHGNDRGGYEFSIQSDAQPFLIPLLCKSNRFFLDTSLKTPAQWDDGPPWTLAIAVAPSPDEKYYILTGELRRGDQRITIDSAVIATDHILFNQTTLSAIDSNVDKQWLHYLEEHTPLNIPTKEAGFFIDRLLKSSNLPPIDLPESLKFTTVQGTPVPELQLTYPKTNLTRPRITADLLFEYGSISSIIIRRDDPRDGVFTPADRTYILRDLSAEDAAPMKLTDLGFRYQYDDARHDTVLSIAQSKAAKAIRTLIKEGWQVYVNGKLHRPALSTSMRVNSGIDWFGLEGTVEFNGPTAELPTLLLAIKRGRDTIKLSDGSVGLIPEDWIAQYQSLAKLGTEHEGELRYTTAQAALLDSLLAEQPQVDYDHKFQETRKRLQEFESITPIDLPVGFKGEKRSYQKDCLGWFHFLKTLRMGGCLADDMGVGKTIQVLAQLEIERDLYKKRNGNSNQHQRTSLAVVIPSVVFQWLEKAKKYTPKLRVLDHTESTRHTSTKDFHKYDLVVTTYGTLIRDIQILKDFPFNYIILDEPEPIKNPATQTAKAARLIKANHKLALTGTPIENHLGEAWALFDFLSPGMLGASGVLALHKRQHSTEELERIGNILRPFILRRTKQQTKKELPPLQEQILHCELNEHEFKEYEELRVFYKNALLKRADEEGANRIAVHVFQALMKLRQAACHPGLLDPQRQFDTSSKLALLHTQLQNLHEAGPGHKALVFSQFSSFLEIIGNSLRKNEIPYETITGATPKAKRGAIVKRFHTDDKLNVFLISLKAGGRGMDITAADYVYLMDPWWNPFAELQAIGRAHRDQQTRPVFAYKVITKNTIEEKVLELQTTKRELVDSIITTRNSMMTQLRREDIEVLFSDFTT